MDGKSPITGKDKIVHPREGIRNSNTAKSTKWMLLKIHELSLAVNSICVYYQKRRKPIIANGFKDLKL